MAPMFQPASVISAKRDGAILDAGDIQAFVRGIADGSVGDAQIGALAMAIYLNGMNEAEQAALTLAMRDSGSVLHWGGLSGPVLDKHSTGGVGDLVSLVLGPLVASCGAFVPMISGRGLGHTGGTLDKLESIPGLKVQLELDRFREVVREVGVSVVGQSPELAPADGRIYAVRDITGTVGSIPLIVSSILSKKLSEGLDGLVMDIKTGSGAFMESDDRAWQLAASIAKVAGQAGLPCRALVTDMNQPLAHCAGNALEILEAIRFLRGEAPESRLEQVVLGLGIEMLLLGRIENDAEAAERLLRRNLASGAAAERFGRMVSMQGGPVDLLENPDNHFQPAPVIRPLLAERSGFVACVEAREVGGCVHDLGGGRASAGDNIDHRVGVSRLCSVGEQIGAGEPVAWIHAAAEPDWQVAAGRMAGAIEVSPEQVQAPPAIHPGKN